MDKELKKKAVKAGIEIEEKECSRCKGEGTLIYPDPLDLRVWREKHGVNRNRFAGLVIKPDGSKGVSVGWLVMIEETNPDKVQQRCPEWLLREYLRIPDMKLRPAFDEPIPQATLEQRQRNIKKAIERRRAIYAEKRRRTVRKGQVFRRTDPDREKITLVVVGTVGKKAIVRPRGEEEGKEMLLNVSTLLKDYEDITPEAAA